MNGKLIYLRLINCVKSLYLLKAYIIRYWLCTVHCLFKSLTGHFMLLCYLGMNSCYVFPCRPKVKGQKVTWLTPHPLQQVLTDDIDYISYFVFRFVCYQPLFDS